MTKPAIDTSSYKYSKLRIRDRNGDIQYSAGNGDAIAKAMLIFTAAGGKVKDVAKANELSVKNGGNHGIYRMAVGVALRGKVRNGESVRIGAITVSRLSQHVKLPKVGRAA